MSVALLIIGVLFLIFRIWLTEFKLKDELQFRRHYLSRFLNYYYCFALISSFTWDLFNFILISETIPLIIALIGWDIPFFIKFKKQNYWKKNKVWLIIERATLHPPMIGTVIWMFFSGLKTFVDSSNLIIILIITLILGLLPYFLLDRRWTTNFIGKGVFFSFRWEILTISIMSLILSVVYFLIPF
ncbi:MAG: hypothetical protein ACTSRX_07985 [Promethearchaeota archaeon]